MRALSCAAAARLRPPLLTALAAVARRSDQYDFVVHQFLSTRNAYTSNPVLNYLWGGMQFQLEHHLFPFMPKYNFAAVRPRVRAFAKQNGLDYREDGVWQILSRNFGTMKRFAEAKHSSFIADKTARRKAD